MKKIICIMGILALGACERPKQENQVTCKLLSGWQHERMDPIKQSFADDENNYEQVRANIDVFTDHASVTVNGKTARMEYANKRTINSDLYEVIFTGNFPGTTRRILLGQVLNTETDQLDKYVISFDDDILVAPTGESAIMEYYCK